MRGIWYYRHSGRVVGPIDFDELVAAAASGTLLACDDVRSGRGDWVPAHGIAELSGQWAENPPAFDSGLAELLSAAPDFEDAAVAEPVERRYSCRINGHEDGPFTVAQLQDLIEDGRLRREDRCLEAGSRAWTPCGEITELDFSRKPPDPSSAKRSPARMPASASDPVADDFEDVLSYVADDRDFEPEPSEAANVIATRPVAPSPAAAVATLVPAAPKPVPNASFANVVRQSEKPSKPAKGEFTIPLGRIGYVAAGVAVVAVAAFFLWPKPARTVRGTVTVDGVPVPLGTISIVPKSPSGMNALSLPIVDGEFRATNNPLLLDGKYDISVVVGNELGMKVARIDDSPLAALNGARFRITFDASETENSRMILRLTSQQAVKLDRSAELKKR